MDIPMATRPRRRGALSVKGRQKARRARMRVAHKGRVRQKRPIREPGRAPRPNRLRKKRAPAPNRSARSEEHTSELQSLMRTTYAVFCLKKNKNTKWRTQQTAEHENE